MSEPTRLPLLEVSPVLEYGSPTPLSTHWMPLHELTAHWIDTEMLLLPAPVAPILTAVGHALFAMGRETRALRLHTQAWRYEQERAPAALIQRRLQQAVRHLHEAAHHWSRAAFALDTLQPTQLDPEPLDRARQLSRIARTQQERLWALIAEVQVDHTGADSPGQGDVQKLLAGCASGDRTHTRCALANTQPASRLLTTMQTTTPGQWRSHIQAQYAMTTPPSHLATLHEI